MTTLRIKRRTSGGAGAPASLKTGELAWNMVDGYVYGGFGDDGSGNATSIKAIAHQDFSTAMLVPAGGTAGQVLSKTSNADYTTGWSTVTSGGTYTAGTGLTLTGSQFAVDFTTVAPLASPALTGTPTAPTQAGGDNSTKLATTAFVSGALVAYAPLASPALTGTPTAPTAAAGASTTQIATTAFVQQALGAQQQGLSPKQAVRAVAIGNVASLSGTMTIDGVALAAGDRVLLVGQSTPSQNGIYVVASGAWTRAVDMDAPSEVPGTYVLATNGASYGGHGFVNTNDPDVAITLGTTALTFVEFTGATDITAGAGIAKTGNTLAIAYGAGLTLSGNNLVPDFTVVAPLASPAFTGSPTAPTQAVADNSTKLATTAWVIAYIAQAALDGGTF